MNISIRQLNEADWLELRNIRLKALRSDPSVFGSNYQKEVALNEHDWRGRLEPGQSAVFVLYDGEHAIGMTGIGIDRDDPTKKTAFLWGSWLEPDFRGKGLSKMMYEQRIIWAKEHSTIEKVIVSHRATNSSSQHANQKHGFVFTHAEDKIWPDGVSDKHIFYALTVKPLSSPGI